MKEEGVIFKYKWEELKNLDTPIDLDEESQEQFYSPSTNDIAIAHCMAFQHGFAIVEQNKQQRQLKVLFYNEKIGQYSETEIAFDDTVDCIPLKNHLYKRHVLFFYTVDIYGVKTLRLIDLATGTLVNKPLNSNNKIECVFIAEKLFVGSLFESAKSSSVRNCVINLDKETNNLSVYTNSMVERGVSLYCINMYNQEETGKLVLHFNQTLSSLFSVIINNIKDFKHIFKHLNELDKINALVCRDLRDADMEELEQFIKQNPLKRNVKILFINKFDLETKQVSRPLTCLLRENNTIGDFFYMEYDKEDEMLFFYNLFNVII